MSTQTKPISRKRQRHRRRQFERLKALGSDAFYILIANRCQCWSPVCKSVWAGDPCEHQADTCWCGAKHPYCEPQRGGCGGFGSLDCHCGGDLCVCHNHGEIECFGCEDCEGDRDDEYEGDE